MAEEKKSKVKPAWDGYNRAWVYSLPPVDWWGGWIRLKVGTNQPKGWKAELVTKVAKVLLEHTGWEGDSRSGYWYLSALPMPPESAFVVAVKQDNNGSTFVVSQVPLAHLHNDNAMYVSEEDFDWRGVSCQSNEEEIEEELGDTH